MLVAVIGAGQPALAADPVNPQVTDAVTQANVKVVAQSPAMAMGSTYQTMAQSMAVALNNSQTAQQTVLSSQSLTTQGVMQIYSVDTAPSAPATPRMATTRQDTEAKVMRKIDAMAQRLAECGDSCVLNMHFHVPDESNSDAREHTCDAGDFEISGADISVTEQVSPSQLLATCIVARMETHSKVDVEGVAWVIEDAPLRAGSTPVASIDMYVQRLP